MAILWHKQTHSGIYEVRTAGNSRRLYKDGVLHSAYNPGHAVTGNAWDLLMLPAFFYPKQHIQNVLLMGVGGGAVIHLLNRYIHPKQITGIEFDRTQLEIGKRFFGLKQPNVKLIHADAIEWLKNYQGPRFDMIIDDLFIEDMGEPVASAKADNRWFSLMLKHLQTDGVIVKNFIEKHGVMNSAPLTSKTLGKRFKAKFLFTHPYNENTIGAYLKINANSRYLRNQLAEIPGLNPRAKTTRLRFSLKRAG